MTTAVQALGDAILTKLRADAGVSALVGTDVFETAPESAKPPMIAVNALYSEPWDTDTTTGESIDVHLSVFAVGPRSRIEAQTIGGAVKTALHRQPLTVTGHSVMLCQFIGSTTQRADGAPFNGLAHGIYRFNVKLEKV